MPEIVFDKDFPEILQPQIETWINEFAWLLPIWLQRFYVGYRPDNTDDNVHTIVNRDYRFSRLNICPHFLTNAEEISREDLIHELIHCLISPLKNYAFDVIDEICPESDEPKLNKIIKQELKARNEGVTQDFAYAIGKKFKNER